MATAAAAGVPLEDRDDAADVTTRAMDLLSRNQAAEAERLFFQALALNETHLGIGHVITIASIVDCSRVMQYQGKHEEALAFSRMELARAEKAAGVSDPNIAIILADIASIMQHLALDDRAIEILRRELTIRERQPNYVDWIKCLTSLGALLIKQQAAEQEGLSLCQQAHTIAQTRLGPNHPETVSTLYYLADAHLRLANPADALVLFRLALSTINRRKMAHPLSSQIISGATQAQEQSRASSHRPGSDTAHKAHKHRHHHRHDRQRQHSEPASSSAESPPKATMGSARLPKGWELLYDDGGVPFYLKFGVSYV